MLVPATVYKTEVEQKFAENLYSDEAFYYTGYAHGVVIPEIREEDGLYQWAIVDDSEDEDRVVGYICYRISEGTASRFGLFSFDRGNAAIAAGIMEVMERLSKTCRRVEWRMISGNPVQRHYEALCAKYRGNTVRLHEVCQDAYGEWHDEYIYEIFPKKVERVFPAGRHPWAQLKTERRICKTAANAILRGWHYVFADELDPCVEDMARVTREQAAKIRGIGKVKMAQIEECMAEFGVKFKGEK